MTLPTQNLLRNLGFLCFTLACCARPVAPTGGNRDAAAPIVTAVSLPDSSLNSKPKKITFYFDENVIVKSPGSNIVISPIISPKPRFNISNKSVSIIIDPDSLAENTTYNISFNGAVVDLNENNPQQDFSFSFSTGSTLDTHLLSGRALYAKAPKKIILKLRCYAEGKFAVYTAKVSEQIFTIRGLNNTAKNVVVFNDENNNDLPDPTEDIGFVRNRAPGNDSLFLMMYERKKIVVNTSSNSQHTFITGIPGYYLPAISQAYPYCRRINDTLFSDSTTIKSIKKSLDRGYFIVSEINEIHGDRPTFSIVKRAQDQLPDISYIHFNKEIKSIDTQLIHFSSDSGKAAYSVKSGANIISIKCDQTGTIKLDRGAITFTDGSTNIDSILAKHIIFDSKIRLTNNHENTIRVSTKIGAHNQYFSIHHNETISLNVSQGTYSFFYFQDGDSNGLITPPNIDSGIEGEPWTVIRNVVADKKMENEIIIH